MRKGNLTYDLTPLGLIAGKESSAKSIRDRSRTKKISYFMGVFSCGRHFEFFMQLVRGLESRNLEDRQSDNPKVLGRSDRLPTRAAPKISWFQKPTHR